MINGGANGGSLVEQLAARMRKRGESEMRKAGDEDEKTVAVQFAEVGKDEDADEMTAVVREGDGAVEVVPEDGDDELAAAAV